jgi:hypothetical protein
MLVVGGADALRAQRKAGAGEAEIFYGLRVLDADLVFPLLRGFALVRFRGVRAEGLLGFAIKEGAFFAHDVKIRKIIME